MQIDFRLEEVIFNDSPNLMKRSGQREFLKKESHQKTGYWPSAEYIRKQTMYGSKNRGFKFIGENNDSPGSDLIIKLAEYGVEGDTPYKCLRLCGKHKWRIKNKSEETLTLVSNE